MNKSPNKYDLEKGTFTPTTDLPPSTIRAFLAELYGGNNDDFDKYLGFPRDFPGELYTISARDSTLGVIITAAYVVRMLMDKGLLKDLTADTEAK